MLHAHQPIIYSSLRQKTDGATSVREIGSYLQSYTVLTALLALSEMYDSLIKFWRGFTESWSLQYLDFEYQYLNDFFVKMSRFPSA